MTEILIYGKCVLYVYSTILLGRLEAFALSTTQSKCPVTFEDQSDLNYFGDYCQRMAFSLIRIKPDAYRENICYSKCLQSDTCVYYSYDATTTFCIVCLRRLLEFVNPKTGSELVEYGLEPAYMFARVGLHINATACDFLDYTCATRWFGSTSGVYDNLIMDQRITSIQFCQDVERLGGFEITKDWSVSYVRGCGGDHPDWQTVFDFAADEIITGIEIYYSDQYVHGLRFHTDAGNVLEEMGDVAWVGPTDYCSVSHGNIIGMETRSGSLIDAIRFHFSDCE